MENTVEQRPPEGEPAVVHYTEDGDPHTWCGVSLADVAVGELTRERTLVTCPGCVATLVDAQVFAEPEPTAEAAPERRTVSLEVLTPELRALLPDSAERAAARVGVVLRVGGQALAVPDTDAPWQQVHSAHPIKILRGLLSEMISGAFRLRLDEVDNPVELLMPTPDVLAALAGQPDLQPWTERIELRADQLQPGWRVADFAHEGSEELVTAVDDCADDTCPWTMSCVVVRTADVEPVHFAGWQTLTVRIPAAVTR